MCWAMESVSTWVGSQGELVKDTVLCAAGVGGEEEEEEGSRLGVGQVSCESRGAVVWIACWILAANIALQGLFG